MTEYAWAGFDGCCSLVWLWLRWCGVVLGWWDVMSIVKREIFEGLNFRGFRGLELKIKSTKIVL